MRNGNWSSLLQLVISFPDLIWLSSNSVSLIPLYLSLKVKCVFVLFQRRTLSQTNHRPRAVFFFTYSHDEVAYSSVTIQALVLSHMFSICWIMYHTRVLPGESNKQIDRGYGRSSIVNQYMVGTYKWLTNALWMNYTVELNDYFNSLKYFLSFLWEPLSFLHCYCWYSI